MRLWPKALRARFVVGLFIILVLPYSYSRLASRWQYVTVYSAATGTAAAQPLAQHVRIGCYNIAHGRGLAESNWAGGSAQERIARLNQIAAVLRTADADVVVLNEVDFDCSWSHSVNQARYLADKAGYAYCVEQRNIDFRVLFWTWRFGNALLSKHPIVESQVIHLPGISHLETLLGGKKRAVSCKIATPGKPIHVIGAHLSHQSEAVRAISATMLINMAENQAGPTIIAGDLNSTPPDFPESEADELGKNAMQIFDNREYFQRYQPTVPLRNKEMTFHSSEPRMMIDWILIPANWRYLQYSVQATELSDHRPVFSSVTADEDL